MNYIFDLDGTIIDSSERLYRLFQRLVPESSFTKEQYWNLKRKKINHETILNSFFPEHNFSDFEIKWMKMIENPEYLEMDQNYPDTIDVLNELVKMHSLILLTARQSKNNLLAELQRLNIRDFFSLILVTESTSTKDELLCYAEKEYFRKGDNDLFVSDMGKDIIVGKRHGYRTIAITHGFMNSKQLSLYEPDLIIDRLSQILLIQ